mgnify:CR=1 FL=1
MTAGYNYRCVKGSEKAIIKAKKTKEDIEDAKAEAEMNRFIDAQDKAEKDYCDSNIEW